MKKPTETEGKLAQVPSRTKIYTRKVVFNVPNSVHPFVKIQALRCVHPVPKDTLQIPNKFNEFKYRYIDPV
jgi:hypothetical protein